MMPTQGYYIRASYRLDGHEWDSYRWWAGSWNGWMDVRGHAHVWEGTTPKSKRAASKAVKALRRLAEAEGDKFTVRLMVQK